MRTLAGWRRLRAGLLVSRKWEATPAPDGILVTSLTATYAILTSVVKNEHVRAQVG